MHWFIFPAVVCFLIFAGHLSLYGQPPAGIPRVTPPPGILQPTPVPTPMPDTVEGSFYNATRTQDRDVFHVTLDTGEQLNMSESMLRNAARLDGVAPEDAHRNMFIQSPKIEASAVDSLINGSVSPDPSQSYGEPTVVTGGDGKKYVISDDPLLKGNVALTDEEGNIVGSMSIDAAKRMLQDPQRTDDQKIQSFLKSPFNVPNELRDKLASMSREDQVAALEQYHRDKILVRVTKQNEKIGLIPRHLDRVASGSQFLGPMAPPPGMGMTTGTAEMSPRRPRPMPVRSTPERREVASTPPVREREEPRRETNTTVAVAIAALLIGVIGTALFFMKRKP